MGCGPVGRGGALPAAERAPAARGIRVASLVGARPGQLEDGCPACCRARPSQPGNGRPARAADPVRPPPPSADRPHPARARTQLAPRWLPSPPKHSPATQAPTPTRPPPHPPPPPPQPNTEGVHLTGCRILLWVGLVGLGCHGGVALCRRIRLVCLVGVCFRWPVGERSRLRRGLGCGPGSDLGRRCRRSPHRRWSGRLPRPVRSRRSCTSSRTPTTPCTS
ncbi:hypothetical protein DMH18_40185 [Streptomyces sp. WAC 06783]|nr:hypothetical protein DMH18_40185 [Streptomyces sp. WAC 06783]